MHRSSVAPLLYANTQGDNRPVRLPAATHLFELAPEQFEDATADLGEPEGVEGEEEGGHPQHQQLDGEVAQGHLRPVPPEDGEEPEEEHLPPQGPGDEQGDAIDKVLPRVSPALQAASGICLPPALFTCLAVGVV